MTKMNLPFSGIPSFCRFDVVSIDELQHEQENKPQAAIIGAPFDLGTQVRSGSRYGPRSIREMSLNYSGASNYNYDLDGSLLPPEFRGIDCGDVDMVHYDADECLKRIKIAISKILDQNIMPIILGGDHSITIPALQAFKDEKPFTLIQLDSHLDYVDSIAGVSQGQGSPIRRASEITSIKNIVQLGIHGAGSSSREDFNKARKSGSIIIGAQKWKKSSTGEILNLIPDTGRYYVTLDLDVMDATIAPGVGSPELGGVHHERVREFLIGLAEKGDIIGFDVVELCPPYDPAQVTSLIASNLTLEFLGASFR